MFNLNPRAMEVLSGNLYGAMFLVHSCSAKEKADVDQLQEPSVKQFLEDQGQYDQAFTKEQVI